MNIRPAILIIQDNKILTMQYRYGDTDVYNLPGGNVEFGETMSDTLAREMVEELNIEVTVNELIAIGEVFFPEKKKHTLHALFKGKIINGDPIINPAETSALAVKWLNINDLPNINLYPNITNTIVKYLNNQLDNPYIGQINQQWF